MSHTYLDQLIQLLTDVNEQDQGHLQEISQRVADKIEQGGIVQLFGSGHSNLLAQEPFYRAGGFVPVKPILIEPLMLHHGALQSSTNERDGGFSQTFLGDLDFREEDVVIVISTSGRNPVPVDVAMEAKRCGALTLSVQSLQYKDSQPSRHESGKRLEDVVDAVLDTQVPVGDALVTDEAIHQSYGPASTVMGASLLHTLFAHVIEVITERGQVAPIFRSGNIEGAPDHNQTLIQAYNHRINF